MGLLVLKNNNWGIIVVVRSWESVWEGIVLVKLIVLHSFCLEL